ncbi:MAG: hypothetical protein BWK73_25425 [Thiothrix lacustris]|uniref:FtsK domain-containing protein n=1 Tax=Thiothrix lacustris TaxID=525917 RepID=A0A1Y1QLA3_9GAMM|nr:MAG: hypothetical protein BWK73_25425 [Thiothrix lacustris]
MTAQINKISEALQQVQVSGDAKAKRIAEAVISKVASSASELHDYLDDGMDSRLDIHTKVQAVMLCAIDMCAPGKHVSRADFAVWVAAQRHLSGVKPLVQTGANTPIASMSSAAIREQLALDRECGLPDDPALIAGLYLQRIAGRRRIAGVDLIGVNVDAKSIEVLLKPTLIHMGWVVQTRTDDGTKFRWSTDFTSRIAANPTVTPVTVEQFHVSSASLSVSPFVTSVPVEFPSMSPLLERLEWSLVHGTEALLGKRATLAAAGTLAASPLIASAISTDAGVNVTAGILSGALGYIATLGTVMALRRRADVPVVAPVIVDNMQTHHVPHVTPIRRPVADAVSTAVRPAPIADQRGLAELAAKIDETFSEFGKRDKTLCGSDGTPVHVIGEPVRGITVDVFYLDVPLGVSAPKVEAQAKNLRMNLRAADVRIEFDPAGSHMRVLVARDQRDFVAGMDLLAVKSTAVLPLYLGFDVITRQPIIEDLDKLPHLLVAGATQSGKSTAINVILAGLHRACTPAQLQTVLIDAKGGNELRDWESAPHCFGMATDAKQAIAMLRRVVAEMDWRKTLGFRDLRDFTGTATAPAGCITKEGTVLSSFPSIVVMLDEQSELMLQSPEFARTVEELEVRIAQAGRAFKIHIVICTQRPEVDVVTGLLKANIVPRLSFQVASKDDSLIILDKTGAQDLYGSGEFLFTRGGVHQVRGQAGRLTNEEIAQCVKSL